MICLLKRSITPLWRPLFIIEMPYSSISIKSHFCIYYKFFYCRAFCTLQTIGVVHLITFARFLTYCLKFYLVDKKALENKNNGIVDARNHATMHSDSFYDSTRFVICFYSNIIRRLKSIRISNIKPSNYFLLFIPYLIRTIHLQHLEIQRSKHLIAGS